MIFTKHDKTYLRARTGEMRDKTVDLEEGFALMRAYLCTGSADWLEVTDSDRSDVKPVKWVSESVSYHYYTLRI